MTEQWITEAARSCAMTVDNILAERGVELGDPPTTRGISSKLFDELLYAFEDDIKKEYAKYCKLEDMRAEAAGVGLNE